MVHNDRICLIYSANPVQQKGLTKGSSSLSGAKKMKKAIILAAGLGKRLGSLTKDIPKCLLVVDEKSKKTLLDFSLSALLDNGVNEIVIVTGFAEEALKSHISKNWSNKLTVNFVFNDKFAEHNNIYSAYLARDFWDDETVLLNSDIIFHQDILKNLKKTIDNEPKSYLIIDDVNKLDAEDMKVKVNAKREIKEINKKLDCSASLGEYIGITYLRGVERVKFLESLK